MHVGSSLPARKKLREMDRDKQSSKHAFGAWSDDPTNKFVGGSLAVHRSVILVQLPDDSSLVGNGNSNCPSRFSSSSSLLVLALRLTAVSSASHPVSTKIRKKIVGPDFFLCRVSSTDVITSRLFDSRGHHQPIHTNIQKFTNYSQKCLTPVKVTPTLMATTSSRNALASA